MQYYPQHTSQINHYPTKSASISHFAPKSAAINHYAPVNASMNYYVPKSVTTSIYAPGQKISLNTYGPGSIQHDYFNLPSVSSRTEPVRIHKFNRYFPPAASLHYYAGITQYWDHCDSDLTEMRPYAK